MAASPTTVRLVSVIAPASGCGIAVTPIDVSAATGTSSRIGAGPRTEELVDPIPLLRHMPHHDERDNVLDGVAATHAALAVRWANGGTESSGGMGPPGRQPSMRSRRPILRREPSCPYPAPSPPLSIDPPSHLIDPLPRSIDPPLDQPTRCLGRSFTLQRSGLGARRAGRCKRLLVDSVATTTPPSCNPGPGTGNRSVAAESPRTVVVHRSKKPKNPRKRAPPHRAPGSEGSLLAEGPDGVVNPPPTDGRGKRCPH